MNLKPKVALAQDFLSVMARLPNAVQGKILKWAIKFQSDPTSSGINYENINGARDSNLKSVRLDRDWRGIVFKPNSGDIYVLLYVDHHDDAYRWAENRKLAINPVTGAMQMVIVESVSAAPTPVVQGIQEQTVKALPLFGSLGDCELLSLGVPEELLPEVRALSSEQQLDALQSRLPVEGYEGLFLVAAGDTVSQVLTARETRVDRKVDTTDFAAALVTPESQSRFVIVDNDEAMLAIMNAPLAQWRVFLHPTQHKLASGDRSGPVRVLGGAGTGKTVLAMHRAKWLADNRTSDGKKVLFVAEKLAALEVVKNRLSLAGLDPFVLELHSNKTNKKRVLEEISKRTTFRPNHPNDLPRLQQQLEAHRQDLKAYTDLINSVAHNEFGLTLHQIMWRAEKHRQGLSNEESMLSQINISDATQISEFEFGRRMDCLGYLGSQYKSVGGFDASCTFWGFYPERLIPGDEVKLTQLFETADEWGRGLVEASKDRKSVV